MIRILFSFTLDAFKFIVEAVSFGFSLIIPRRDYDYHAHFESGWPMLSRLNEGVNITGKKCISKSLSERHTLIIGPSGSGKSTVVFFSSLLTLHKTHSSFVINDPSKELWKCASFLEKHNYNVLLVDFSSINSIGFNPLAKIAESSDINKLASMIIRTTLQFKEPFWDASGMAMIETCTGLALRLEPQYRNLANVRRLVQMLSTNPERMKALMVKHATNATFNEYKNILKYDDKLIKNIVATTNAALNIFASEDIARVTSTDSLQFEDLRKKPIALFIQNRITDTKHYNVLISIFFESLFKALMHEPIKKGDRTVYFFIDEMASGLYLPSIGNVLANSRKALMPFVLGIQDISQLTDTYNREIANTLITNCYNKLYMTGMSLETANMLEATLGKYTYLEGKSKRVRRLMTSWELRTMPTDRGIFIAGNYPPVYAKLHPVYTQRRLLLRMNMPPLIFKAPPLPPVTYIK